MKTNKFGEPAPTSVRTSGEESLIKAFFSCAGVSLPGIGAKRDSSTVERVDSGVRKYEGTKYLATESRALRVGWEMEKVEREDFAADKSRSMEGSKFSLG